jgi:methylphosphotriester-DNA--protein-cysteine methyltransferase
MTAQSVGPHGPRGLRYAFRRQADVTPTGYLRRVRLERAQEELRFGGLGQFERLYAEAYGCTLTETRAA